MKVVVIGNGMVGQKFCEKLVAQKPESLKLTVFGEETLPAYDRVHLSAYFAGKTVQDLCMKPMNWYKENQIDLHLGDPVVQVDRDQKVITSFEGKQFSYDYLVFATGSAAFVPPISGVDKHGVFVYRTIEDLNLIWRHAKVAKSAVVIGGGLLGLEAAKAMLDLGITDTHVIEFAPRLMPRQIDEGGSHVLTEKLKALGIVTHTQKNTAVILGNETITGLMFTDGSILNTDMLVISAGIKPRDELAKKCGLTIGHRGGISVNDQMQTSDPFIYAIGECAVHEGTVYGLVAPGYEMAEVVAHQLSGGTRDFRGFDMSTKLKLIGIDVASFGDPFTGGEEARSIIYHDNHKGIYKRINVSNDGKELLGGILVGDAETYNQLQQICTNRLAVPSSPADLIVTSNKTANGADDFELPAEALICSCEGVKKQTIEDAVVRKGCESFDAVKKCTGAGSGCGGCTPMVKDIITATLKKQGKAVRNVICEHFAYSRQELYDLTKIKDLHSFDEVLDTLGAGDGCEICRPAVSSILASLWNDLIIKKESATSQDTNDRFLANIQKGGTYSVVPRIPGGEITPEKLIVIGEVAKKYNLYTKITGGQRIDLFGAHLNDLPLIWEELIAAGFESGHAYGKALRTVKSCVGSTWCRFGLHDSVSFAIRVENRYKGLRAPHKIKSAVSGCIRECAEAQSKDFGIIATEKGWNLYVCGNGGSKPQHALLLAADIDSETCIKYIDRFLMFYIKTADPLTRTATWLNKMEGGIDYLRNVVVHDSLGIGAELEAQMQTLADHYECEWKKAVETPELRKRFAHFINAPEAKDPTVVFETMRGQKKAAEW
ncbi:nitrite reductase large subunit [Niabella ginsenosidivorans]|uniref:Nitrite reductase large subunit n=1 Tax=Niabella ginsenosidivorans TaxID=1176587 RepID=A0A1A9HWL2_9BACT|nr:nitrite reductase large subunit NirB [Niabella ginsenosidivorans]ANH79776.1 nitrite reductase large subunit [Niabella ginsenosidivorans]